MVHTKYQCDISGENDLSSTDVIHLKLPDSYTKNMIDKSELVYDISLSGAETLLNFILAEISGTDVHLFTKISKFLSSSKAKSILSTKVKSDK